MVAKPLWSVVTTLTLLSAAIGAHAADVTVSANCNAQIFDQLFNYSAPAGFNSQRDCSSSFVSAPLTGTVTGSANVLVAPPTGIFNAGAFANYSARGNYGNLGVSAHTWATNPSTSPFRLYELGTASASVSANDSISVTSALLAQGTFVTIALAGALEGALSGSIFNTVDDVYKANTSAFIYGFVDITEQYNGPDLNYIGAHFAFEASFAFNGPYTQTNGGFSQSFSETLAVRVGSTLSIHHYLTAFSESYTNDLDGLPGGAGRPLDGTSSVEAMNSFTTFLTPITDGVQLLAQSDHNYSVATPVPEPETYAMILAGLGLLGFAAWRRKQKEAAA